MKMSDKTDPSLPSFLPGRDGGRMEGRKEGRDLSYQTFSLPRYGSKPLTIKLCRSHATGETHSTEFSGRLLQPCLALDLSRVISCHLIMLNWAKIVGVETAHPHAHFNLDTVQALAPPPFHPIQVK